VVTVALFANVYFYALFTSGWLRFATILWLYGALFWFSLHIYLVPLLVHVAEPKLFDVYRRAALIALGHPLFTLVVLIEITILGTLCLVFIPAYVLIGPAYLSMIQAHAFRDEGAARARALPRSRGDIDDTPAAFAPSSCDRRAECIKSSPSS